MAHGTRKDSDRAESIRGTGPAPAGGSAGRAARHREWLLAHRDAAQSDQARAAALESRWSWARLLFFFGGLGLWVPLGSQPWLAGLLCAAAGVAFVVAVRRHEAARAAREFCDRVLVVIDESVSRCGGQVVLVRGWEQPGDATGATSRLSAVLDDGACWELTDQERDDLDLFARPVGLFGLLNRTSTHVGARRLRDRLNHPMLSPERIRARQASVEWLAGHPAERLRLLAAAAALRKEDARLARFVSAVSEAAALRLPLSPGLVLGWSNVTLGLLAVLVVQLMLGQLLWGWALLPLLAVNTLLYALLAGGLQAALAPWRDVAWAARGYLSAAQQAAADLPADAPELGLLRARLSAVARGEVLPAICARLGWTESGGLIGLLINTVAFSDLRVARALLARVVPQRAALLAGVSALADLESLLSLACFAYEQPVVCWPVPVRGVRLDCVGGRHPLVAPERVVPNDVRLDAGERIWIITGSNMAGKSTLLRMIGANLVLAQLGGPVTAERFEWSPLRLITDLRARDNLAASESYFLSEVRHLRRMVVPPAGDTPILGLIDEPFRGTNSHDQTAASRAVVLHLLNTGNLFVVATHDRWLTELADGVAIRNRHFRENLDHGRDGRPPAMVFDYRLHDGPATTRNALLVLEREGYPAELLAQAHAWEGDGAAGAPAAGGAREPAAG
ncbi:MAG: hypothetical protein LC135_08510 [Phycisphaerae bacterium]|nr:hypothetical protein [Phycisphaerae bacterium]MCZ2399893.1 hypothetical protein [Phycisphaerae bacterium]